MFIALIGVAALIVLWFPLKFAEAIVNAHLSNQPLVEAELVGTWKNTEGEGSFELRADGAAHLTNFPKMCDRTPSAATPLRPILADGEWKVIGRTVSVSFAKPICGSMDASIYSDRNIWGMGLIPVGDPDRPETLQRFVRVDSR